MEGDWGKIVRDSQRRREREREIERVRESGRNQGEGAVRKSGG